MGKTVSVTVKVTVDVEDWAIAYGLAPVPAEVRDDLKSYLQHGICGAPDAPLTVEVKP